MFISCERISFANLPVLNVVAMDIDQAKKATKVGKYFRYDRVS